MAKVDHLIKAMTKYFSGDVRRVHHFLKVYGFAKTIGEMEKLDINTQELLEVTAIIHDIGTKVSEEKYNSSAGNYQQIEGPPVAEKMLTEFGYPKEFIERSCYLIAHHHTYHDIEGIDYQILVEADFLVNIYEHNLSKENMYSVKEQIFRTESGTMLLEDCYDLRNKAF